MKHGLHMYLEDQVFRGQMKERGYCRRLKMTESNGPIHLQEVSVVKNAGIIEMDNKIRRLELTHSLQN